MSIPSIPSKPVTAKKKNWMSMLSKMEGAVDKDANPYAHIIRTPSPSVNFTFGNTHGLPQGYTLIMFGPPAGGKTLLTNSMVGQLHRDDPEAIAIKFDTEEREALQNPRAKRAIWGIDENRYQAYSVNKPDEVFDRIKDTIGGMCSEGAPVRLIIIDSLNGILGRRTLDAESVLVQQIGDDAKTLGDGLKWILDTIRRHRIGLVLTAHARAEMDQLEIKRGNKIRMGASYATQHFGEYFMAVEHNRNADARKDLLGREFVDESLKDMTNRNSEITAHKIRCTMKKSSAGPRLRVGEFTLDYNTGIVNAHEELFTLGLNRNIIEHKSGSSAFSFAGRKWTGGKAAVLKALEEEPELRDAIQTELKNRDLAGLYRHDDAMAARKADEEEAKLNAEAESEAFPEKPEAPEPEGSATEEAPGAEA